MAEKSSSGQKSLSEVSDSTQSSAQSKKPTTTEQLTKPLTLMLQTFLDAQKLKATRIEFRSEIETSAGEIVFYLNASEDKEEQTLQRNKVERTDLDLLIRTLQERSFYWPNVDDELFESSKRNTKRILFAPISSFRLLADYSVAATREQNDILATLDSIEWSGLKPITERLPLSPTNKEFLLKAAKQKSGIILTSKSPTGSSVSAEAIISALRPDAILIDPARDTITADTIVSLASNNLTVLTLEGLDPVEIIYNFLANFPGIPEKHKECTEKLLLSFVHQRVLRTCGLCARSTPVPPDTINRLPEALRPLAGDSYMFSRGCAKCGNTAYRGSVGIESIVCIDDQLRNLLVQEANAEVFTKEAYRVGTRSLLEDGMRKIYSGLSSFEQVFGITNQVSPPFALAISERHVSPDSESSKTEDSSPLPAVDEEVEAKAPETESVRKRKLLIIEDEVDQRDVLKIVFRREGYDVVGAGNGREALDILASDYFDIILCDVMMPVMNGIDFVKQIRKDPRLKSIPVLMLTAVENPESEETLLAHGADDYCRKNLKRKNLLARVNNVIDQKLKNNPLSHLLED